VSGPVVTAWRLARAWPGSELLVTQPPGYALRIQPSQLDNPSPCDEWTVRDVLNHITGGADMFARCIANGALPLQVIALIGGQLNGHKGRSRAVSSTG
jgi:hypothetical protein